MAPSLNQPVRPLIKTKLAVPQLRSSLVTRPRLLNLLAEGSTRKLTLICAPPGYGKTTLIMEWMASLQKVGAGNRPTLCWLSLDAGDNDLTLFSRYLVQAVENASALLSEEASAILKLFPPPPFQTVLSALINCLEDPAHPIYLVLDDYQFITNQAIHEGLAYFLDCLPATLHLMIATRSDPPLPLARLRAHNQLVEIRADDLRFNADEAAAFLTQVMNLTLSSVNISALETRTEGWIAGLQMAALSMRGREDLDSFIREFAGTNRFIMDFMLEEVLAREPEVVQDFLLQTAFLTRLSGPLCDAVTGTTNGQKMLERLERRNLFVVPLDDDRRWYRYHHLFADLLNARLYQSGPERVARLLSCAAEWCERDGQITEAVSYAFAARDYERAAGLIEKYWQPSTNNGEIETVWSWLNALPENAIRNSLPLSVAYCWILWLTGRLSAIEAHLVHAERALGELDLSKGIARESTAYAQLPAVLVALRSFVSRYKDEFETAIALAERAFSLIPENLPPQDNAQLHMLVFLAQATAYDGAGDLERAVSAYSETIRWSRFGANASGVTGITYRMIGALRLLGRLQAADAACREALRYIQDHGMARLPAAGILHLAMSEVLVERNDLEAAEAHLSQGIELGKWSGRLDAAKNSAYVLSRLRQMQNDLIGALAAVNEAESAMGEGASFLAKADMLALKARILVRKGSLGEAARCVGAAEHLAGRDRGQTGEMVALAASRVLLAQYKPEDAASQLMRSIAVAEECGRLGVAIELHILRCLALAQCENPRGAETDLERAFTLAEPGGYVRVFVDEGQPMQMLIAQWLTHSGASPLRDYAIHLLSQFDSEPRPIPAGQENASPNSSLVEPLSQRELEVLDLLALGSTNQEIARQLIVARGTVKAHAASIYRKLDVTNRTEAVARARQLGILP